MNKIKLYFERFKAFVKRFFRVMFTNSTYVRKEDKVLKFVTTVIKVIVVGSLILLLITYILYGLFFISLGTAIFGGIERDIYKMSRERRNRSRFL